MEDSYSRATLLQFLDTIGAKGLANPSTAQSFRVACGKILVDLTAAEEADVRKVDVDLAIRKFNNKNPGVLSPASLGEYKRRVAMAIKELGLYVENPTAYKGFGRAPAKKENGDRPPAKRREAQAPMEAAPTAPVAAAQPPTPSGLTFAFPLRPDFLAQLVLPRDLRADEATRLCNFVKALAVDTQ